VAEERNMNDITTIVDTYLAAFNETDAARSQQLTERAWAGDGRYVDPMFEVRGHAELAGMGPLIAAKYPGHRFRRVSGVDSHHGQLRFAWEFAASDGKVVMAGLDIGELASDGRLQRITGFFGPLPDAG
jgi:hypothetical protein